MKPILISIQPKRCELIASGKKTIEVRKTRPKIETPFKCYIYCTHNNRKNAIHIYVNSGYGRKNFGVIGNWRSGKDIVDVNPHLPACRYNAYLAEGKVIGEFICNGIITDKTFGRDEMFNTCACMSEADAVAYCQNKEVYGWHISDLKIYDKPMELSEFYIEGDCDCLNCKNCAWFDKGNGYNVEDDCALAYKGVEMHKSLKPIIRPPQSWCYVEAEE